MRSYDPITKLERDLIDKRRSELDRAKAIRGQHLEPKPPTAGIGWIKEAQDQRNRMMAENGKQMPDSERAAIAAELKSLRDERLSSYLKRMDELKSDPQTAVLADIMQNKLDTVGQSFVGYNLDGFFPDNMLGKEFMEAHRNRQNRISDLSSKIDSNKVEPSPYTDSKAEATGLLARDALNHFSDKDVSKIAWPTGDENALVMGAGDLASAISYDPIGQSIGIVDRNTGAQSWIASKPEELSARLGKDLADKVLATEPREDGIHVLNIDKGEVIGGHGMRSFYGDKRGIGPDGRPALFTGVMQRELRRLDPRANLSVEPLKIDADGYTIRKDNEAPSINFSDEAKKKIREIGLRLFSGGLPVNTQNKKQMWMERQ